MLFVVPISRFIAKKPPSVAFYGLLNKHTFATHRTTLAAKGGLWESDKNLVVMTKLNGVTTLRMNDPKKLNAWTGPMMMSLRERFQELAHDEETHVMILTGTDKYYCSGVNLMATLNPRIHPKKLHKLISSNNQALFDAFLDFPKPILVAANGPAIGASVTSATLCDEIIASDQATFNVPFATLAIPPEGCSSVHFERIMDSHAAKRMLEEGWKPSAEEAVRAGFVSRVVADDELMNEAQKQAEGWISEGKVRWLITQDAVDEYKAVNARESIALADAFLSRAFLDAQVRFLEGKGKKGPARMFRILSATRWFWGRLL